MKKMLFIMCFLSSVNTFSQSNFKKFFKLSRPIKTWVFFHPFKANKALQISNETNKVADSVARTKLLDGDRAGGQVDAFRHAYWMARLRQEIGKNSARSLGKAHEKDNYLTYKKKKLEDGVVPDKISSEMDLFNNDVGLTLSVKGSIVTKKNLIYRIVNAIQKGKMKIIKKDKKKQFLTCKNEIISTSSLKGSWKNTKCLVASDKLAE